MTHPPYPSVEEITKAMKAPTKEAKALVEKAYHFAEEVHKEQKRYSGEPYFTHVAHVGLNLANIGIDATTVAAGLLHDTIEDADISEKAIEKEFGKDVAHLVEGVSKLGKLKYRGVQRHVESLRKFFIAMSSDIRVPIIKLADRLHNIQTLEHVPEAKRQRIAVETLEIHARLADRLGMGKWKSIFEDAAFPYAYPEDYQKMLIILKKKRVADEKYANKIYKSLQRQLVSNGVKNARVDYRVKNLYSLWRKLVRKDMDIEKIFDILAVRVIVKDVDECYQALGIIHKHWKPVPGRIKDYIAVPKPNGYRSLHTTIFRGDGGIVEIQIRTEEMHGEAQYGIAAHLVYKEGKPRADFEGNAKWVRDLVQWQKDVSESKDFLENLNMDFFKERVFVFTPKGDVVDLPDESCPIDFAYAIHSDIGDHVSGVKINGKMAAIDSKLNNGDIVEIETRENAAPKAKWLDFTKTTLARRHIRTYLEKTNPIEILAQKFLKRRK